MLFDNDKIHGLNISDYFRSVTVTVNGEERPTLLSPFSLKLIERGLVFYHRANKEI